MVASWSHLRDTVAPGRSSSPRASLEFAATHLDAIDDGLANDFMRSSPTSATPTADATSATCAVRWRVIGKSTA
jgi:hypothetical protein